MLQECYNYAPIISDIQEIQYHSRAVIHQQAAVVQKSSFINERPLCVLFCKCAANSSYLTPLWGIIGFYSFQSRITLFSSLFVPEIQESALLATFPYYTLKRALQCISTPKVLLIDLLQVPKSKDLFWDTFSTRNARGLFIPWWCIQRSHRNASVSKHLKVSFNY